MLCSADDCWHCMSRPPLLLLAALLAVACGGGSSPVGLETTPSPGYSVSGFVFYDENANGTQDPEEIVRLPGVGIAIGGRSAQSTTNGRFTVSDVPSGTQAARAEALSSYFRAGSPVSVGVPLSGDVAVPAVLDLNPRMRANVYMAFGDSITVGDGSSGGGYRDELGYMLRAYWGKAEIVDQGQSGTKSIVGSGRIGASLSLKKPAYALILYGTNDYNEPDCRNPELFPCYTIDSLRSMVQETRGWGAWPVLGTIPPVNPAWVDRNPEDRNDWVRRMNELVRTMARQQQVAIAEIHGAFLEQSSLPPYFADDKHPNDAGYQLIARAFFKAITQPLSVSTTSGPPGFFLFRRLS